MGSRSSLYEKFCEGKKYLSPVITNEIISLLVLCTLLSKISESSPSWFSIMVDKASDASHKEQLNLSVR